MLPAHMRNRPASSRQRCSVTATASEEAEPWITSSKEEKQPLTKAGIDISSKRNQKWQVVG